MGACQEKKRMILVFYNLFAKAASFYSTSQAAETDSSKKCEDNTSKDCKSQDVGCSKDPLDEKLIQHGIELIDTFMKAASVAPAPTKESSNDKCIVSDDNEFLENGNLQLKHCKALDLLNGRVI